MKARELAAKIVKGQIEADIEFHKGLILWAKISWGIIGFAVLCLVLALVFSQLAWAVVGFLAVLGNLVLMYFGGKRLVEHQCVLPNTKAYLDRKKTKDAE